MPSMGTIPLSTVKGVVLETLNLSKNVAYGSFDGSPLYKDEFINQVIFNADVSVLNAIMASPGHPRRQQYTLFQTLTVEGIITQLSGAFANRGQLFVEIVRNDAVVVVGKPAPAAKIADWVNNKDDYGDSDCVDGYYNLDDGNLIFSGDLCNVLVLNTADHTPADTSLFAPPEYIPTIERMAVGELLMKDPAKRDMGADYLRAAAADIQLIMGGSTFVPPFEAYQQSR